LKLKPINRIKTFLSLANSLYSNIPIEDVELEGYYLDGYPFLVRLLELPLSLKEESNKLDITNY
jgi:hypothetical protein